ncbi:MAG: hypothetical protein M5R40_16935 [Anaerolineae bacterium]|nr:hypothetical protein [Anaerolineae bacterium]
MGPAPARMSFVAMSHEHATSLEPVQPDPDEGFGFTEEEQLFYRVSHERFQAILEDEATTIHRVDESSNNYGEFLFVTVSQMVGERRVCMTFYGLGLHELRERWLVDEWHWYEANSFPETLAQQVSRQEAKELMDHRHQWIRPFVAEHSQSERGRLFEFVADLTDDDAAYGELQDLESLPGGLGEAAFQSDMFTGELVDNRTPAQKRRDEERSRPQQLEMFSQRDIAQFGAGLRPMPLPASARLSLQIEDHRTPEEIEADIQREAEKKTAKMFGDEQEEAEPPLSQLDEIKRGLDQRLRYLGVADKGEDE